MNDSGEESAFRTDATESQLTRFVARVTVNFSKTDFALVFGSTANIVPVIVAVSIWISRYPYPFIDFTNV
jgi:hypothetical protein